MKTYYVLYKTFRKQGRECSHWEITETEHNLDSLAGLSAWIEYSSFRPDVVY